VGAPQASAPGEIVAKAHNSRRFSNQPVAEIVQCGEPSFQVLTVDVSFVVCSYCPIVAPFHAALSGWVRKTRRVAVLQNKGILIDSARKIPEGCWSTIGAWADLQLEYAPECGRYLQQNRIVVVAERSPKSPSSSPIRSSSRPSLTVLPPIPQPPAVQLNAQPRGFERLQPAHQATTVG
jgi:hypothetical protein